MATCRSRQKCSAPVARLSNNTPVTIWVNLQTATKAGGVNGNSPVFLGTGETAPDIEIRTQWEPLMNDLGGSKVPFDYLCEGEEAIVSVELTRWNEKVLKAIQARPHASGGPRGTQNYLDIGSLMLTENLAYTMWLYFPFSQKAAFQNAANGAMPEGYRFPATFLEGPDVRRVGTKANKVRCIFHCIRYFTFTNGVSKFVLFDENMASVKNLIAN